MQPTPQFRSTPWGERDENTADTTGAIADSSTAPVQVLQPDPQPATDPTQNSDPLPANSGDILESRDHEALPEELNDLYSYATQYEMTQDDVRAMALMIRDFLGAPYVWGGSSIEGTDCSGFVHTVYRDVLGVQLPRSASQMYTIGAPVERGPLQFADLLFFNQSPGSRITHVGIYIAQKKFVHASPTKGVMVSGLDEKFHREHFVGARRIVSRAPYDRE